MNALNPNAPRLPCPMARLGPAMFDHEKLDVYQLLLQFITWVTPLIEEAKEIASSKSREVCDQLDRASLSALLNTAEGNGKRQRQVRAKFFDDARGSATECAACLDALVAKAVVAANWVLEGNALLLRIVSILCKLIERFDESGYGVREDPVAYRISMDAVGEPKTRTRTRTRRKR